MKLLILALLLTSLTIFSSCKYKDSSNKKTTNYKTHQSKKDSITVSEKLETNLTPFAEAEVKEWKAYHEFNTLLNRYKKILKTEALSNSKELSDIASELKDSIKVEDLNTPDVKARFDVLYNETLRLNQLTNQVNLNTSQIESIITDIFKAFSASNAKINNVYSQKQLEEKLNLHTEN